MLPMKRPLTFIQQVDELILKNIAHPNMLLLLKVRLKLSKSQIYRKIKKRTRLSPSLYIRQKRLAVAYDWLRTTDAPVSEIAKLVGFKQVAYFSRCFSGYYGISPSRVRVQD